MIARSGSLVPGNLCRNLRQGEPPTFERLDPAATVDRVGAVELIAGRRHLRDLDEAQLRPMTDGRHRLAGGFRERASLNKIFVQREADPQGQKPTRQSVDAEVGPGDTIIVEESFF